MPRPGINIMVMRQGESDVPIRSYSVPWYVPRAAMLLGSVLVCFGVLAAVLLLYYYSQSRELERVRGEMAAANAAIQKIEALERELNYHREFTRRVAGLLGISVPDFADSASAVYSPSATAPAGGIDSESSTAEVTDDEFPIPGLLVTECPPDPNNRPRGMPLAGRISRGFAPQQSNPSLRHMGVDFAVREGTSVLATANGTVESSGEHAIYGLLVVIDHGGGFKTSYGHNSLLLVRTGEWVRRGDRIAVSGNTGISSAPHLHYEISNDGQPVDPGGFLGL